MRDDMYSYDMANAYETYKGTKRGEQILAAARYMVGEDGRRYVDTRGNLLRYAGPELERAVEEARDNDRLITLAEKLGKKLSADFAADTEDTDAVPPMEADTLYRKEETIRKSLHVVVSDETIWDIHGYELDEVEALVEACRKREDTPDVVAMLSEHFGKQPDEEVNGVTMEELADDPDAWKGAEGSANWDDWWEEYDALVEELGEMLSEGMDEIYWKLYAMASQIGNMAERLGRFDPVMNRITLYLYPIVRKAEKLGVPFGAALAAVYAHEFFHACHASWMEAPRGDREGWNRGTISARWRDTLKEGLADYFAYTWCRGEAEFLEKADRLRCAGDMAKAYETLAQDFVSGWTANEFPGWPYAGAKVFLGEERYGSVAGDPWCKDGPHAYEVLYLTLSPYENHWRKARDTFLKSWKQYRQQWVRDVLVKPGKPGASAPALVELYRQNDSATFISVTAAVKEDGSLEVVSEISDKTDAYPDSERHMVLGKAAAEALHKEIARGPGEHLLDAVKDRFGGAGGMEKLEDFCRGHAIPFKAITI